MAFFPQKRVDEYFIGKVSVSPFSCSIRFTGGIKISNSRRMFEMAMRLQHLFITKKTYNKTFMMKQSKTSNVEEDPL